MGTKDIIKPKYNIQRPSTSILFGNSGWIRRADPHACTKNVGRVEMLNLLTRFGPFRIDPQSGRIKGGTGRTGSLTRLQNYIFSFFLVRTLFIMLFF